MRTYYLRSFGCQMNEHDAERIRAVLEDRGFERVDEPDWRRRARLQHLHGAQERRRAARRAPGRPRPGSSARTPRGSSLVTGCLPQAEKDDFFAPLPVRRRRPGAAEPAPPRATLLQAAVEPAQAGGRQPRLLRRRSGHERRAAARRERPFQALGADHVRLHQLLLLLHRAATCAAPSAAGVWRTSWPRSAGLVADGVREITLLGQNVNAYGLDLAPRDAAAEARGAAASRPSPRPRRGRRVSSASAS